jgi:hypothetical protein
LGSTHPKFHGCSIIRQKVIQIGNFCPTTPPPPPPPPKVGFPMIVVISGGRKFVFSSLYVSGQNKRGSKKKQAKKRVF